MGGGTSKSTIKLKDLNKIQAGRKICYCQTTVHNLVNNCIQCGKIVCDQEGEGPCLFCGTWVDRDTAAQEVEPELEPYYEMALNHRDKLIDFDLNAAKRLGVLDERSDWYDLSQNTWLNKDQRKFANQMLDAQKKKDEEIDK